MPDLWTDLLGCLDLEAPADAGANGHAVLRGRNQELSYHRIFGGQLLAQFLRAACLTCPDKAVKSVHTLFAKEGNADEPVCYEVTKHHEGRSFAGLSIIARQAHGVAATASVSMHAPEAGLDRQTAPVLPSLPKDEHRIELGLIPWETRTTTDLDARESGWPEFDLWMRTPAVDPGLAPALVAYATDLSLIGTALRPVEGVSQRDAGKAFTSAVTSHTVWFHRPFRTDGWLLLRQHSPVVAHGRCFGRGDVLTEDASLVASYAQEALLRFPG
ncbi:acyl-CoA thioesterase II [Amycolatopsis acidicola]|uniref:Acyl-CoA thioesterase II n=1 Tax=Amycolatopsis acidicola TaxID=2596893 RepID=A0A5N0UUE2_9PSEU|nr:acyl-CoA thioesterase domain-containing protein [Amycolatopsis acidicola]KAA9156214.1 acyl-CoA thioesterase II [Amycolatopsis acidicola]